MAKRMMEELLGKEEGEGEGEGGDLAVGHLAA